jgi:hypothetical protein
MPQDKWFIRLQILGICSTLMLAPDAGAQVITTVPASSCLRLNHTAQALTEFHNGGLQNSSADARARFAVLQSSEQSLERDPLLAGLPAMTAVQRSWQPLNTEFRGLPAPTESAAMQQQLHELKNAYRTSLNGLIVSIRCQP